MTQEAIYEKLRNKIDTSPRMSMPPSEEILEILRLRFSPEEAEVAVHLPADYYQAATAAEIAKSSGLDESFVKSQLESMLEKGSIFWLDVEGTDRYCLMPIFGFFEIPFADGRTDPEARRLAELWDKYFGSKGSDALSISEYKWARVLPATRQTIIIGEKVNYQPEILTWENVKEYLKGAEEHKRKLALVKCSCRVAFQNCDKPIDACIAVGSAAKFFLKREKALKELNTEEALEILRRNLEEGLVLTTNNMQYGFDFICSCCTCCCGILRSHVEWKKINVLEKSNFIPQRNEEECTECGICVDMCQFHAWDDDLVLHEERCIGCGVCEVNCPEEALTMKKVSDRIPAKGPFDAWSKVAETRLR
jgi:Pyruvate/2-oxoacid:ferredoxin oxidoreductase delta subunit